MPSLRRRSEQPSPVNPQVPIPNEFPSIPKEIKDRFPEAEDWQRRLTAFWTRVNQAIQEAQSQSAKAVNSRIVYSVDQFLIYSNDQPMPLFTLDSTGVRLGDVLVVNTPARSVYIGGGHYQNDDTPFYVDTLGRFSLGASLSWDPETDTLNITGTINATSGTIGGFEIGPDYIRDTVDTFGLASTVTGGGDVRFWAGDTFANRGLAPVRIYDTGQAIFRHLEAGSLDILADGTRTYGIYIEDVTAIPGPNPANILAAGKMAPSANSETAYGILCWPEIDKGAWTGLTVYGNHIRLNSSSGAGTIANAYGLYIDTVSIGSTNWGLYVGTTAKNYMAGALQIAALAGVGTRNVVVDASGNLSAP